MRRGRNHWGAFLVILLCAIAGGAAGRALSGSIPVLADGISFGIRPPVNLDLYVISIQLGFGITMNIGSALGILVGLMFMLAYSRGT